MSAIDDFGDSFDMIVVMGVTGAGKSHFINRLSGTTVVEEGSLLSSCRFPLDCLSNVRLYIKEMC